MHVLIISLTMVWPALHLPPPQPWQALHNLRSLQADDDYFANEARYVLGLARVVMVVDDAAVSVGFDVVLVDDPAERDIKVLDRLVRVFEDESELRITFARKIARWMFPIILCSLAKR